MIDRATTSIDLASFYAFTEDGKALEPVLHALERARNRGVSIRLLFDNVFYGQMPELPDQLARLGYAVRKLDIKSAADHGGVMHAKYLIIDRAAVALGSANFDWRSLLHIHELGLQLESPGLAQALSAVFEADWASAGDGSPPPATKLVASYPLIYQGQHHRGALLASPPDMLPQGIAWELPALVSAIDAAQNQVHIQLLSFHVTDRDDNPFPTLADALVRAAGRGVRVSLLISDWNAEPGELDPLIELSKTHGLTIKISHIPAHSSGFIPFARVVHSKFMTIDTTRSWVGSSNWGGDYFHNSRNVGLLIEGSALAHDLDVVFAGLWDSGLSETVMPGRSYEAPRFRK